ncbi:MAG: DegT/DnrJ/EryC1/StrS family aminotransferase [Armatimonadetes bacterium]|nr:DegT/DnrJ/EryC1/StrS family aminotransferase [Armatimonadota bacterium]MDE2206505.1 DegT/DnrJ/EryC1/StrS family aminotransferase [Armatimonadota bacterium]
MAVSSVGRLAIDGGTPVRDIQKRPWPQWPVYDEREQAALERVLKSGRWWYVEGDQCVTFEKEFAALQNCTCGVTCTTGSAALEIALRALDIGCEDEVIVPAYTFVATASAVLAAGAVPVFADIQPDTFNIDAASVEAAVTPKTRAIIPVHIGGRPADMDAICAIATRHGLAVIEDAAQAHGAAWRGKGVGSLGDLGTFSFQASKNLNGGEGGMIVSTDARLGDKAWSVMNVGRVRDGRWYEHHVLGSNFRMTEWQAAVLRVQLQRLPEQMVCRSLSSEYLHKLLADVPGILLPSEDDRITSHARHLITLRYQAEEFGGKPLDWLVKALCAEGIPCSMSYVPLYREEIFRRYAERDGAWCKLGRRIDYPAMRLPACETVCRDTIWITQHNLLGPLQNMDDVAEAFGKVRRIVNGRD